MPDTYSFAPRRTPSRFDSTEIPDWRPMLALANALREKGDLYEARHLYLQVDRIASWQQDWESLIAAACGIKRLDGAEGPYSKTFAILVRAMTAVWTRIIEVAIESECDSYLAPSTVRNLKSYVKLSW